MNFHSPNVIKQVLVPMFAQRGDEIIIPEKIYTREEYPSLPHDMVKIVGRDGRKIYINRNKVHAMDI